MNKSFNLLSLFLALSVVCWAGGNKEKETPPQIQTEQQTAQPASARVIPPPPAPLYWAGDGGDGMSLGILVPESQGLNSDQAYLPSMIQGVLVTNISRYSAISVLDRESLDRVMAETLDPTYEDNLDIVRLGHVAHVGYMMTGKIIRTSTGYTLQINVTDTTPNARTIASYSSTATVAQLDDHTAIQTASRELLTQMGVQLTDRAITALSTTNSRQSINGETALARAITAQRNGTVVEALSYYYQAKEFDPSLLEAASRASVLSAAITGGNIGENVRNDIQWRNEWIKILREADDFYRQHRPYEIIYDPTLIQGRINYNNNTVELSFRIAALPVRTAFNVMNDLSQGLFNTGKSREWSLDSWPFYRGPQNDSILGLWNPSYYRHVITINTELKNQNGKTIGTASIDIAFELTRKDTSSGRLSMPGRKLETVSFREVKADDITDNLSVSITSVNGISAEDAAQRGYMSISTGILP